MPSLYSNIKLVTASWMSFSVFLSLGFQPPCLHLHSYHLHHSPTTASPDLATSIFTHLIVRVVKHAKHACMTSCMASRARFHVLKLHLLLHLLHLLHLHIRYHCDSYISWWKLRKLKTVFIYDPRKVLNPHWPISNTQGRKQGSL